MEDSREKAGAGPTSGPDKQRLRELRRRMRGMGLPVPGGGLPINRTLNYQPTPKPMGAIAERNEDSQEKSGNGSTGRSGLPPTRPNAPPPPQEASGRGSWPLPPPPARTEEPSVPAAVSFLDLTKTDPFSGENPFHESDPRHEAWKLTTRRAEEELARETAFLSEACEVRRKNETRRFLSEVSSVDGGAVTPVSMAPVLIPIYLLIFDTWAWRGLVVVASECDLATYDEWLVRYARGWVEYIERDIKHPEKGTIAVGVHRALEGRIGHWKSIARKELREREESVAANGIEAQPTAATEAAKASRTAEGAPAAFSDLDQSSPRGQAAPQTTTAPEKIEEITGSHSYHDRGVQKVKRHFGRDDMPAFVEFYSKIVPSVTHPEFAAWKRGDTRKCGKTKWAALDKAANELV